MGNIPRHVAVIMDGNRRWAKRRLLPGAAGHRAGMNRMIALSEHVFDCGVEYCTLFALSTENLSRSEEELEGLFRLFRTYFPENAETLKRRGITLRVPGDLSLLPPDVAEIIRAGEATTAGGTRGTLALAIGYGGRQDILQAVNRAVEGGKKLGEEEFSSLLYTAGMPEPDLLIRTGNELRISNFLLWQAAYAELYFTEKLFPDFSDEEFDKALAAYAARDRRYGKR